MSTVAQILATAFQGSDVKPVTSTSEYGIIAQYKNDVLNISVSDDPKTVTVFRYTGYAIGGVISDTADDKAIQAIYLAGLVPYLRTVIQRGNAEHLPEPFKLYLLRYGQSVYQGGSSTDKPQTIG